MNINQLALQRNKLALQRNKLALQRNKLANQNTYLSYMNNGFNIAAIGMLEKKIWICIFGIIMLILSSIQYMKINNKLDDNKVDNKSIDNLPLFCVILFFGALYLDIDTKN